MLLSYYMSNLQLLFFHDLQCSPMRLLPVPQTLNTPIWKKIQIIKMPPGSTIYYFLIGIPIEKNDMFCKWHWSSYKVYQDQEQDQGPFKFLNYFKRLSFILGNPKLQSNASKIDLKIDVMKSEVMSLNTCHPQKDY